MVDVRRRLLALSWAMPPLVYPRAIQVAYSLKELSSRGWATDVIALDPNSKSTEIQDLGFAEQYNRFYRLSPIDLGDVIEWSKRHPKIYDFFMRRFPRADPWTWFWTKRAHARALALVKSEQPQALITFAQPWADHLIGLSIKRRFPSLPWIAHFSDPWVDNPYLAKSDAKSLRRWSNQERDVVEAADSVVFVNDRTAKLVMAKYPVGWRSKAHVVPHGFDPNLMALMPPCDASFDRPRIVYTGAMFFGLRDPMKLLEAIACLKTMLGPEQMPMTEFVGSNASAYQPRAEELGLTEFTRFGERVSYLEALKIASCADILLVIDTNMENGVFLPSKVADYLMLGKPIFALTSQNGATSDALRPLGHTCVGSSDPVVIARALADTLHAFVPSCKGGRRPQITEARDYHISNTTDRLEAAITAAVGRKGLH